MFAIILAIALSFVTTQSTDTVAATNPAPVSATPSIGPCATEDSDNCYRLFGGSDGIGQSFVTINGTTYYLHG